MKTKTSSMTCADCGMFLEPADTFHPGLHCWLFKRGVLDPSRFLADWGYVPDPTVWREPGDRDE